MPSGRRLFRSLVLLALPLLLGGRAVGALGPEAAVRSGVWIQGAGVDRSAGLALSPASHPARPAPRSPAVARALALSLTTTDPVAWAPTNPPGSPASLSAPRQSLPPPVHDEATCAFCQAAIFPPCAPQPVAVSLELLGLVRREQPPTDALPPQFTSHRRTSSRAPPLLRVL